MGQTKKKAVTKKYWEETAWPELAATLSGLGALPEGAWRHSVDFGMANYRYSFGTLDEVTTQRKTVFARLMDKRVHVLVDVPKHPDAVLKFWSLHFQMQRGGKIRNCYYGWGVSCDDEAASEPFVFLTIREIGISRKYDGQFAAVDIPALGQMEDINAALAKSSHLSTIGGFPEGADRTNEAKLSGTKV